MKKIIAFILIFIGNVTINAQIVSLDFGPTISKIEWTNSWMSNTSVYNDRYSGYHINLGITYFQKSFVELITHFGYNNIGGTGTILMCGPPNGEICDTVGTKSTLGLLSLGSGARLKLELGEHFIPYINIGIGLDYLARYKETPAEVLKQFEEIDELNRSIFKALFGAGMYYHVNKWRIGILYEYDMALNPMVKFTSELGVTNKAIANYSKLGLSIAYSIN